MSSIIVTKDAARLVIGTYEFILTIEPGTHLWYMQVYISGGLPISESIVLYSY
jgi:hypothetical protein